MEFGGFDDSIFGVEKKKTNIAPTSYNAKWCEPQWFCKEDKEDCDEVEQMNMYKYRGDSSYHNKNYQQALQEYQRALDLTGVLLSGGGMRRELSDAIARCHIELGHADKALDIATQLWNESAETIDQKISSLTLQSTIYHLINDTENELVTTQKLLTLNPYNSHLWYSLALCYENRGKQQEQTDQQLCDDTSLLNIECGSTTNKNGHYNDCHLQDKQLDTDIESTHPKDNNIPNHIPTEQRLESSHATLIFLICSKTLCNMLRKPVLMVKTKTDNLLAKIEEHLESLNIQGTTHDQQAIAKHVQNYISNLGDTVGSRELEKIKQRTFKEDFEKHWIDISKKLH